MLSAKLQPFRSGLNVVEPLLAPSIFEAVQNLSGHPVAGGVMKSPLYSWWGHHEICKQHQQFFFITRRHATVQVKIIRAKKVCSVDIIPPFYTQKPSEKRPSITTDGILYYDQILMRMVKATLIGRNSLVIML